MKKWSAIDKGYRDEFGTLDPVVYEEAGKLFPNAQKFALLVLGDDELGLDLMRRAVAIVTRRRSEVGGHQEKQVFEIANLPAYLYKVYKRLILAEVAKREGHRALESQFLTSSPVLGPLSVADQLDRKILTKQVLLRMNAEMRRVFELRVLGYTFEEVAREQARARHASIADIKVGPEAKKIQAKFSKEVQRLRNELGNL